jgi:hypothetical protein
LSARPSRAVRRASILGCAHREHPRIDVIAARIRSMQHRAHPIVMLALTRRDTSDRES